MIAPLKLALALALVSSTNAAALKREDAAALKCEGTTWTITNVVAKDEINTLVCHSVQHDVSFNLRNQGPGQDYFCTMYWSVFAPTTNYTECWPGEKDWDTFQFRIDPVPGFFSVFEFTLDIQQLIDG